MMQEDEHSTLCKAEFTSSDGFCETYELSKLRMTVGAHIDADIGFPGLSFEHADLRYDNGSWVIRKLNPEAVLRFRGLPVEIKKLNPGDRLFLGAGTLTFLGTSDEEVTAITMLHDLEESVVPFQIAVMSGSEKGRSVSLKPGEYTLGRTENPNICSADTHRVEFNHRFISRSHARIFVERFRMHIQDMDSTNGTRINGRLIKTGELNPGDTLTLGKLKLRVSGPDSPDPRAEVIPTVAVRLRDTTWTRIICLYIIPGTVILLSSILLLLSYYSPN